MVSNPVSSTISPLCWGNARSSFRPEPELSGPRITTLATGAPQGCDVTNSHVTRESLSIHVSRRARESTWITERRETLQDSQDSALPPYCLKKNAMPAHTQVSDLTSPIALHRTMTGS